jgi:hypothetical protein
VEKINKKLIATHAGELKNRQNALPKFGSLE